jgi:hypothetical protein
MIGYTNGNHRENSCAALILLCLDEDTGLFVSDLPVFVSDFSQRLRSNLPCGVWSCPEQEVTAPNK